MKTQPTQHHYHSLLPLLAISALAASASVCRGDLVFSDDFSEAPGTAIVGKSVDVGGAWTGSAGNPAIVVSSQNSLDTSGDARTLFALFTSPLGAGQVLTLTYDGLTPSTGNFLAGWSGVSLYSGGTEQIFTGDSAVGAWGLDGGAFGVNHQQSTGDTAVNNSVVFRYVYDTGAYSFTTSGGFLSGTATAGLALDQLRVANGNGGDINLDNLAVDISAVPEPSSIAILLASAGMVLGLRRRMVRG